MSDRFGRAAGLFAVLAAVALLSTWPSLADGQGNSLDETVALCTTCHGEEGIPVEADAPIIWGQEFYYLYVQLKDYKAGRRANEFMSEIVAALDRDTMKALAQHFSEKTWPRIAHRSNDDIAGQAESAFAAGLCTQCHLGSYTGNSRVPRLAGQQPDYLERTMADFKHKVRLNSPAKGSLFAAYEDDDIAAMADFLGGM